jgi:hypothetical protein
MEITVDRASWSEDASGFWVKLRTEDKHKALELMQMDKPHTVTIEPKKEKRSLEANKYMWQLLGELAAVVGNTNKDELYLKYLRAVGIFKDFTLTEDEAKTFEYVWHQMGTVGWPTERVDYDQDGERVIVRAYYGTSRYNTRQMSRLIDAVVQDCQSVGIETKTPAEIADMMSLWAEGAKRG